MIQLLVVLVVVGILMALVASVINGARKSGQRRQAIETARTIAEAADRFRLDHGERPPLLNDAEDWPVAKRGPRNFLTSQRYMKSQPDALASSWLSFGPAVSQGRPWSLVYRATTQAPHGFRIDVVYRGSADRPSCTIVVDRAPASTIGTLAAC